MKTKTAKTHPLVRLHLKRLRLMAIYMFSFSYYKLITIDIVIVNTCHFLGDA